MALSKNPEARARQLANLRQGAHAGFCKRGHDLRDNDPKRVYLHPDGRRECRICRRKRSAEYRERNRARINEYRRIWAETKRRERNAPQREQDREVPRGGAPLRLPAEPFTGWLGDRAEIDGIDDAQVRRLVAGTQSTIHFDVVDRVLTRAGEPWMLDELYPLEGVSV